MQTRICPKCLIDKPAEEFYKEKRVKDGLQKLCKVCKKADSQERYRTNGKSSNFNDGVNYLNDIKQQGCSACPEKSLVCLQFHHVNGKSFTIGAAKHKVKELRAEVSKCILLCANCHCKVHAGELDISAIPLLTPPEPVCTYTGRKRQLTEQEIEWLRIGKEAERLALSKPI
jgi:hypothetical protein